MTDLIVENRQQHQLLLSLPVSYLPSYKPSMFAVHSEKHHPQALNPSPFSYTLDPQQPYVNNYPQILLLSELKSLHAELIDDRWHRIPQFRLSKSGPRATFGDFQPGVACGSNFLGSRIRSCDSRRAGTTVGLAQLILVVRSGSS